MTLWAYEVLYCLDFFIDGTNVKRARPTSTKNFPDEL